jgi:hypothetical protein
MLHVSELAVVTSNLAEQVSSRGNNTVSRWLLTAAAQVQTRV